MPPAQLGSYLREFQALMADLPPRRVWPTVTSAMKLARPHRLSTGFDRRSGSGLPEFAAAAELVGRYGGSMSGEHGDGRRPERAAALHVFTPRPLGLFSLGQGDLRPADDRLNPGVIVAPAVPRSPTCGCQPPRPLRTRLRLRLPARRRRSCRRAVHRCVGVGKCRSDTTTVGGVMCPSYLATRDEKDSTRGRARVLQELANGSAKIRPRPDEVAEGMDFVPVVQGLFSSDCPAGIDMATAYKAEALHQRLPPPAAAGRRTTHPRLARPGGPGWPRVRRGWPTRPCASDRRCRRWPSDGRGRRSAARCPRSPSTTFRPSWPADWPRRRPSGRCCYGSTPSANHFIARGAGWPRGAGPGGGRLPGHVHFDRAAGLLRADLDLDGPARRGPAAAPRAASTPWNRRCAQGMTIVGLEPSCTAVRCSRLDVAELLPDDPRAAPPCRRRTRDPGRAAGRNARLGWTPAADLTGHPRRRAAALSPTRRAWGGTPMRSCWRRSAGARDRRRSAAAVGWPATSASSAGTTTCRSRWPRRVAAAGRSAARASRTRCDRAGRRILVPHPA